MGGGRPSHIRRIQRRKEELSTPVEQKENRTSIINYLWRIGTALLFTLGTIILQEYFWVGMILIYLGFSIFVIDALFSKLNLILRFVEGIIALLAIIAFSVKIVFSPALLVINAREFPVYDYPSIIGGIEWKPEFSQVEVTLTNSSDGDYTDMRFDFGTDLYIVRIGQLTEHTNVEFQPHTTDMKAIIIRGDKISTMREDHPPSITYGVYCDRLRKKDRLRLVLAVVGTPPMIDVNSGKLITLPDSKKIPKWLQVEGHYKSRFFRPRHCAEKLEIIHEPTRPSVK